MRVKRLGPRYDMNAYVFFMTRRERWTSGNGVQKCDALDFAKSWGLQMSRREVGLESRDEVHGRQG